MKLIDLLNKMSDGSIKEGFKFKIKDNNIVYRLTNTFRGLTLYEDCEEVRWGIYDDWLNREVEIVHDKIENLNKGTGMYDYTYASNFNCQYQDYIDNRFKKVESKLNEVIDKLNEESED